MSVSLPERALAVSDPWESFAGLVTDIGGGQEGDAGFSDLLATVLPEDGVLEELLSASGNYGNA
jgi:hypothetical protein